MATESHYLSFDWRSLPPNKQLPHYPSELHPPLCSCFSFLTPPSILSFLIQSPVDSSSVGCMSAIASIIHSHVLCVYLLYLLLDRKPGLNWSTADLMWKKVITWVKLWGSVSKQPGSLKAHNLNPGYLSERQHLSASPASAPLQNKDCVLEQHHHWVFGTF